MLFPLLFPPQRDECQSKIQALQERNEKDIQQYTSELKELQRTLDHDERLKDFLFNKSNDRAFAAAAVEDDDKDKGKKAEEEKEKENALKYKEAFDRILAMVGGDSDLVKIVADFVRVEDQNFALFNYVTEMNNQVEALQEGIARLRSDIKEAKGRGEERERQQLEQLGAMEKKLDGSVHEAESAETKLQLMESVISKLKTGAEDLYVRSGVGSTPVLSLLTGGTATGEEEEPSATAAAASEKDEDKEEEARKAFVTEANVIMYLDMVHEKISELKAVSQFMAYRSQLDMMAASGAQELGSPSVQQVQAMQLLQQQQQAAAAAAASRRVAVAPPGVTAVEKQLRRMPSSAQLLGKNDEDLEEDPEELEMETRPFDLSALKTRAFVVAQRERREAAAAKGSGADVLADGGAVVGATAGVAGGATPGEKKTSRARRRK